MRASTLRAFLVLGVVLAGAAPLAGCVAVAAGGLAAGGYTLATEQRTPQQIAQDAAIAAVAHKYWLDANVDLARDLTATVYDGRVLITGIVPKPEWKQQAEDLVRKIDGVKEVYNEIQVGPQTNFFQDARDDIVSNTLRAQLLADPQVRSSNFTIHTLNGIVYIVGYARNEAERDRVISYARNISNVQRVVAFIRVGNQAMAPTPAPAAPANAGPTPIAAPPSAAPTSRDSIQVTPLQ